MAIFFAMEISDRDINEFLGGLPDESQADMKALDAAIGEVMSGLPRELYVGKFWGGTDQEIIGYGRYSYTRPNGQEVEWFVIGLALQKNYISVYVSAVEGDEYLSEKYGPDLGKVKVGKSSISFNAVDDIDMDKFVALISRAREVVTG